MICRIRALLFSLIALQPALWADPFEEAEVTRTVNIVSLLGEKGPPRRASLGDVVRGKTALKTGGDSRAELKFPDFTITRVGSNALFRFLPGGREVILESGTILFSSPKGAGGGKVQAGAVTAAVTGTDFLISNVPGAGGRVKVISLSDLVRVFFTEKPSIRVTLRPGADSRYSERRAEEADGEENQSEIASRHVAAWRGRGLRSAAKPGTFERDRPQAGDRSAGAERSNADRRESPDADRSNSSYCRQRRWATATTSASRSGTCTGSSPRTRTGPGTCSTSASRTSACAPPPAPAPQPPPPPPPPPPPRHLSQSRSRRRREPPPPRESMGERVRASRI